MMAKIMGDVPSVPKRKVNARIEHDFKKWTFYCWMYEWLNFMFGGGGAVLSTLAAGTVVVGSKSANFDFHPTAYLAAASALCTFVNTAFNFGKRWEKHNAVKLDLGKAIVKYESDPTLGDTWLAEEYAKAADKLH